jgi:hypothetical protein
MSSEVFRFVTIRNLNGTSSELPAATFVIEESDLVGEVRRHRGSRDKLLKVISTYIESAAYAGTGESIDSRLKLFDVALAALPEDNFAKGARAIFERAFEGTPDLTEDEAFSMTRLRLGDSIVAASVVRTVPTEHRARLTRLAGVWCLARSLSKNEVPARSDYDRPTIALPPGIFPVPTQKPVTPGAPAPIVDGRAERERAVKSIEQMKAAVGEIVRVLRRGEISAAQPMSRRNRPPASKPMGFVLQANEALSESTNAVLNRVGLSGTIDATRAIDELEAAISTEAAIIHRAARDVRMIRVGSNMIPDRVLGLPETAALPKAARHPGPCSPPPIEPSTTDPGPITVPTGHGIAKTAIAELMIVEQNLARYELGEVAHIENVLQGETRERSNRVATTIEESLTLETEELEENEKDLSTAERFELQLETQQILLETANKQAGITISASYGPTVDATANASLNTTSSRQSSTRVASNFARETTARAASRVQKRRFERKSTKTVREFEERNLHRFEGATANISGVYRFVDKVYTAQVVNYGTRLMLEFIVPEPAAFWRYAQMHQPAADTAIPCPQPPGYCVEADGSFALLQPDDITPEEYLFWAGLYGAEGVEAPPSKTKIISQAKKGPDPIASAAPGSPKMSSDYAEIDIPEGYVPVKAIVNAYGETQVGDHKLMIQIQDKQFQYTEPWDDLLEIPLHQEATTRIPVSINSLRFHNYEVLFTVFCVLRDAKMQEWQLKTYFSIMNAYNAAKSRYENALEAARLSAGYTADFGRNPARNREVEATELKRSCISMMSGQHFDTFDAMTRRAGAHGYPEINLAEAEAEARFVRLFEHGLDWANLTYLFYPYFWTRKDQWPLLSQMSDNDPLFAQFLQAGSARVQVPVRLGFEFAILNYLSGVEIWDADGNLITMDETGTAPQLPMLQELKSRLSNEFEEGSGTLQVTQGSLEVTGTDTEFTKADERRRIRIGTVIYVIQSINDQMIRLDRDFEGESSQAAGYALGPRLVGEPWEVRVPTDLVKLDNLTFN